jgi:hypothetical protein|nr:MAG TPA: hypothetical protein [Caudoviricetes sp.]
MNPVLAYEQGYIPFSTLQNILWDFGPNSIFEIGEKCFAFYCSKANNFHNYDYYIKSYGSDLYAESEWFGE